jgi:hypothetical protein
MNTILLAAIGGGVGAGLGGLLGLAFDRVQGKRSQASLVLAIALAMGGGQVALWTRPKPATLEAQLDAAGPAFRAVHQYYPDVFAQMAADARTVDPNDPIALQNKIRPRLSAVVAAHRAQMDDTSANALGQLMLDETQLLQSRSPPSCVAILGGGGATTIDMGTAFTPELVRRDAEVTGRLIEQVATHPASPPEKLSEAQTQALVMQALKDLSADEQKVVTPLLQQQKTPSTPDEARAFCAFYRSLFTSAMRGPDQTLRRFLAN